MVRHLAPVFALLASAASAQDGISDFKWQSRLLIVSGATEETVKMLGTEKAGIGERDLKVFVLSGSGLPGYAAKPSLAMELESRLSPPKGKPMVYLIGKDGKTTLSWPLADFTIGKLFASIDAMPMRKREMREAE